MCDLFIYLKYSHGYYIRKTGDAAKLKKNICLVNDDANLTLI